jgi:hypothetical protein
LPVQFLDRRGAVFFVQVQDDFGVGLGPKSMTVSNEIFTKFDVVEDFTVERDPERSVGVRHRLSATREIDDAQTRVAEASAGVDVYATVVWTAVA